MTKKKSPSKRPKLLPISQEMEQWSASLGQELHRWPHITTKPMFGLIAFYHKGVIFACLPRTRAVNSPNSLIFKFNPMTPTLLRRAREDPRIASEREEQGAKWYSFELRSEQDLHDALWWLNKAYQKAK